ncbi:unnamed protein product [Sphagnum balticum]
MAFSGTQQKCKACDKTVYLVEQLTADGVIYHKSCFRCNHCKGTLKLGNYASLEGVLYCKPHFEQLLKTTGSFDKSFDTKTGTEDQKDQNKPPTKASLLFSGTQEKCIACNKTVYPIEKTSVEGLPYHKNCFKCVHGGCTISPSNYAALEGRLYCKHHYSQLFKEKGNYSQFNKTPALKPTGSNATAAAAAGGLQQVLLRPTAAEAARTVMEVCVEGTLSTLSQDGWPLGTEVRFAVDVEGNPVLRLQPSALHTKNLLSDSRCSLHAQLEQPGRQKPQCTLRGQIGRVDESKLKEMELAWERRFGKEHVHDDDALYVMKVEQALQAQDMGEEEIWVMGTDYSAAVADPLRECAPRIVEDMNRKHWEDIRRFCNVYTHLDAELEEASMTWVDRLGFDMRVLTCEPHKILEIRIPFPREVTDERDARSALTIMAQIAWEKERNYNPAEALLASV